jgi:uncharacterized protein YdhG (YjbR/CyaY superfamily)
MAKTDFKSVGDYIGSKPKDVQATLKLVRATIRKAVPRAKEVISYQIPAYKMDGMPVLYFAGWKNHYSLYPMSEALVAEFKKELAPYETSKGTLRLPLSEPVPVKLIERIARFRASQLVEREKGKGGRKGHKSQLERVRRICGTLPSASEKMSHGTPSFFVKKDSGVFMMFADNHHEDGRLAVWLPVPTGLQPALIEEAPETYFSPPYVGSGGWIGIQLDQVRDDVLAIHVRKAWELIAKKK